MIYIKNTDDETVLSLPAFPVGSKHRRELMKEDYVTIKFSITSAIFFRLGYYIDIDGTRYVITEPQKPTYNNKTGGFDYELKFECYYMAWRNRLHKFSPSSGGIESSWSLTAPISTHASKIIDSVNSCGFRYGTNTFIYSVDESVISDARPVSFSNTNIIDALTSVAEAFDCEWWVSGRTVYFGKCENGEYIDFEQGTNVEKMVVSDSKMDYATRIFPFGSTRNIPHNYRSVSGESTITGVVEKRLMLPESVNGGKNYIDAEDSDVPVEKVVIFDYIYPKYVCTIQQIETYTSTATDEDGNESSQTFYKLTVDSGFVFSKDYIIKGEELKMTFESGLLRGMEFGAQYHSDTNQFEVVVNGDYGRDLPDSSLYPRVGDTLAFSGFNISLISDLYVQQAEQELYQESLKYIEKSNIDPNTYTCTMAAKSTETHQYGLGQRVRLVSGANFSEGYRNSRIVGFERCLDIPYDHPVYIVGESLSYSRTGDLAEQLTEARKNITDLDKRKVNVDLSEYKKWSETLAKLGMTTIEGGYIMSNMLALADSSGNIMAGMNGLYNADAQGGGVAAWYGGDMDNAKSLFRFDGSGYVANGNLYWGTDGVPHIANNTIVGTGDTTLGYLTSLIERIADMWVYFDENGNVVEDKTRAIGVKPNNSLGIASESFMSAYGISTGGSGGGGGVDISIVNNLDSTSVTSALSANMGRVLAEMIEEKTFDLTSQAITEALGFTPYNSTNFTKSNIKSTLGISDWALEASKPSYAFSEITGTAAFTQLPTMYWANVAVSNSSNEQTEPTFKSIKIGGGKISWDANGYFVFDNGIVSQSFISAFGVSQGGSEDVSGVSSIKYNSQTFRAVDGVIDISSIAIDGGVSSWNDLTDKPTWIGATKPSYAFSEITSKPTTLSGYGITDALPISGGTMTGILNLKANQYNGTTSYGMNANNSNIIGVNSLMFADVAEDSSEGISFVRTGTTWDNLWANGGILYFTPNYPTETNNHVIAHDGIGAFRSRGGNQNYDSFGDGNQLNGLYCVHKDSYPNQSGTPSDYGSILNLSAGASSWQLFVGTSTNLFFRSRWWSGDGRAWNAWKTFAFTDSNVASATKLQTARTLWGNSFDGSANINGNISVSRGDATDHSVVCTNNNGSISLLTSTNRGVYDNTKGNWLIASNGTNSWLPIGNVGIGTNVPDHKLHVNGSAKAQYIAFYGTDGTTNASYIGRGASASNDLYILTYANNAIHIDTNSTERVTITGDGKVGIGTSYPSNKLDVYGIIRSRAYDAIGNNCASFIFDKPSSNLTGIGANGVADTIYFGACNNTGAWVSYNQIFKFGGVVLSTGEVTAYSDARLKTDIKDLDFRGALSPKSFIKDGKQSIGFIAQEVRELYPELVLGEETEDSYLSLNYGAITAVLACQTNDHERRIAELERENRELKRKLNIN